MKGPIYSILSSKCPKCNVGELYPDPNPYHLKQLSKMNERCSCCGQSYTPETGFYYGAMYVSYGLGIIFTFIPAAILYFGFGAQFPVLLGTILGIYVLTYPLLFRMSRNIWLNIFVHFDEDLHEKMAKAEH